MLDIEHLPCILTASGSLCRVNARGLRCMCSREDWSSFVSGIIRSARAGVDSATLCITAHEALSYSTIGAKRLLSGLVSLAVFGSELSSCW